MTTTYRDRRRDERRASRRRLDAGDLAPLRLGAARHHRAQSRDAHADVRRLAGSSRRSRSRAFSASAARRRRAACRSLTKDVTLGRVGAAGRHAATVGRRHGADARARPESVRRVARLHRHRQFGDSRPHVARQLVVARTASGRRVCRASTRGTRASAPTSPGPKLGTRPLFLRAASATRTLPFQAADATTSPKRASPAVSARRSRTGACSRDLRRDPCQPERRRPASEHAWTLSFGISVRP